MLTASCLLVLTAGNLVGAVAKGVTGFGSAILNLCVWVAATCAGIDGGTLQQAVLSECVSSEACALPLLCLTRACSTADWRLVTTLTVFGAAGAPLGAALLTNLNPRKVELVMALVLLAVICLHCRLAQRAADWLQRRRATCCRDHAMQLPPYARLSSSCGSGGSSSSSDSSTATAPAPAAEVPSSIAADAAVAPAVTAASPGADDVRRVAPARAAADQPRQLESAGDEADALLPSAPGGSSDSASGSVVVVQVAATSTKQADAQPSDGSSNSSSCQHCAGAGCWRCALSSWWAGALGSPAARRALAAGSVAGCLSGIMAGMTGMGGPPLMLYYDMAAAPKDVVRGTNALLNVLQARVVAYVLLGAFTRADLALYLAASGAGLVGMAAGHCLAARMDQAAFSRVLVALMVLCCLLMFASAAGLAGR